MSRFASQAGGRSRGLAYRFLTLSFVWAFQLAASELRPVEKQVAEDIAEHRAQAVALLKQAVEINSGTMNFEGVKATGEVFAEAFKSIGFDVRWIDGKAFNRAGHLSARYGNKGVKLLLIGHLDTVFAKDSPFQSWQVVDEDHVKAPGITDMKGGNVVMWNALRALKNNGQLDNMQVWVMLMGDEEKRGRPMVLATEELVKAAKWADYALGFEDGDGDPKTAVVARRGASGWRLKVSAKPAHSSQIFRADIGDGAIFELSRILHLFHQTLQSEHNLTFNPGVIAGGTEAKLDPASATGEAFGKDNVIAKIAVASGDIRAQSPEQLRRVRDKMRAIVRQSLNQTHAEIEFIDGYPPMAPTDANYQLLARYSGVSEALGYGPVEAVDPRKAGAADISFAASHVKAALDGLGLMGDGGHTDQETADMRTLTSQAQRAALLMMRLATESAK